MSSNFQSSTATLHHPPPYYYSRPPSHRSNHRGGPYSPYRKPTPEIDNGSESPSRHMLQGLDQGMQPPGLGPVEDVKFNIGERDGLPRASTSPTLPPGTTPVPGPKKRRRIHLNCEECRRTKSRCNRSWPCSECVKKGLAHICPNQVSKISQPKSQTIADLTDRVKVLEDVLRRNGLDAEIPLSLPSPEPPINPRPVSRTTAANPDENPQSRAWDMTAMLGELTSSTQSKGYAGTEGSAFYLSSPDGADSDVDGEDDRSGLVEFPTPWTRRAGEDWKDASRAGSLIARCRAMLPTQEQAKAMFDHFWDATAWRIQPMTKSYFTNRIIHGIYETGEGPHPHELAVLFATKAMSELFRPTPNSSYTPQDYHELSYACLVGGKFYTETTTASLISLHLLANFFINSDDRKMVDAIFAIIGMAMRLAVIAGYHRDMPYNHLPQEELDQRRRIWYELLAVERVHCLPSLLPGSISSSHYDVLFPSDAHPDGYFVCKWRLGRYMSRVIDCWTARTAPSSAAIQTIDSGLRRLYHSIPQHLTCKIMPPDAYSLSDNGHRDSDTNGQRHSTDSDSRPSLAPPPPDISDGSPADRIDIQQIRLAQHFVMVFFYLHRPSFMQTLAKGGDMNSLSVQTMLETCRHMVLLLKTAMSQDHATVSQWFGFAADLFTTLHCPTALVVKTTDKALASQQMTLLEEGSRVIEWIAIARPSSKNKALAAGTRRLVATARTRYLGFGSVHADPGPPLATSSHPPVGRTPSFSELLRNQMAPNQTVNPSLTAPSNGAWAMDFQQMQPPPTGSSQSSNNPFEWSGFPFLSNIDAAQPQQPPQIPSNGAHPHLQTMSTGQISPMDLTIPMTSPLASTHLSNPINFGHLPMMPNQMDNWPMSMQNLGVNTAPDPYAPSSEGFDMWLSSILSDGNGNGGQGQGNGP